MNTVGDNLQSNFHKIATWSEISLTATFTMYFTNYNNAKQVYYKIHPSFQ